LDDDQLLRYSRHVLLDDLGIEGQQRLLDAHVLVVGAGGLGCPAALYLAASGVGQITVVDHDVVDLTNLQRQIAHTTARIGQAKPESLAQAMAEINPGVRVNATCRKADALWLDDVLPQVDVALDCSDNFATRQLLNAACVRHRVPLVSGAAVRLDAQITTYDARCIDSPCYACVFPPEQPPEEVRCATLGVLAPLVGIVGTLQATEALKLIAGLGTSLMGRLQLLDARSLSWTEIRLQRNPQCPVCGTHHRSGVAA
jgi:molybdopterin/thiamine biosynthesis adenylyltransferase